MNYPVTNALRAELVWTGTILGTVLKSSNVCIATESEPEWDDRWGYSWHSFGKADAHRKPIIGLAFHGQLVPNGKMLAHGFSHRQTRVSLHCWTANESNEPWNQLSPWKSRKKPTKSVRQVLWDDSCAGMVLPLLPRNRIRGVHLLGPHGIEAIPTTVQKLF